MGGRGLGVGRVSAMIWLVAVLLFGGSCAEEDEMRCLSMENSTVEMATKRVVLATAHQPAYLHCKVPDGNQYLVAWTRTMDGALLAVGTFPFTSDPRFQNSMRSNVEWILIIRRTEVADTGCYLCEINTEPSTVYPVFLQVKDVAIAQQPTQRRSIKLHTNSDGNDVLLNCTIRVDNDKEIANGTITWKRDGKLMHLNDTRKYIEESTRRMPGVLMATIRIRHATHADDGSYACSLRDHAATHIVLVNHGWTSSCLLSFLSLSVLLTAF